MFSGGIERERGMKWVKTKNICFCETLSTLPIPTRQLHVQS